jgi:hypothetical protein
MHSHETELDMAAVAKFFKTSRTGFVTMMLWLK